MKYKINKQSMTALKNAISDIGWKLQVDDCDVKMTDLEFYSV